jgi:transposase
METNSQLQEVEKRIKHEKDRRMFERYQTVRLHLLGHDKHQIAKIIGRSERMVRTYLHLYQEGGLDGVQMNFSPGRPERITKEQQDQLKKTIIESSLMKLGLRQNSIGHFN